MANNEDDQVGYSKPPKHSRFKKGQSGNPKGRPKGSQNLATRFEKTILQKVTITENGRSRVVTKADAMFLQMINKAAKGDMKATTEVRYWSQRFEDFSKGLPQKSEHHERDEEVIERMIKRMKCTASRQDEKEPGPDDADQFDGDA